MERSKRRKPISWQGGLSDSDSCAQNFTDEGVAVVEILRAIGVGLDGGFNCDDGTI